MRMTICMGMDTGIAGRERGVGGTTDVNLLLGRSGTEQALRKAER
jgi:hypothetical protein